MLFQLTQLIAKYKFIRWSAGAGPLLVLVLGACSGNSSGAASSVAPSSGGTPAGASSGSATSPGSAGTTTGAAPAPIDPRAGEQYRGFVENDFVDASATPLSTFAVDVDSASYTIGRRDLKNGLLPVADGVRVEEYVNYFSYGYDGPASGPFAVHLEGAPSYFGDGLTLLRVGIQGRQVPESDRKPANLVFLIDVSGSMDAENKLPLVKYSLHKLLTKLRPTDKLGIAVYASSERTVLEPTPVGEVSPINEAIDSLSAGGSTAGAAGIRLAYAMAERAKTEGSVNRVILCTDGDFNVGLTGDPLVQLIEEYRQKGITLSVLGFGMGNYNDATLEQLADKGDGNYAYIDGQDEADRVFDRKVVGTLQVIAKDVKVQVAFDPAQVRRYRLIGYENRVMNSGDFRNDSKDGGEIGAGHTVTALYEVEPQSSLTGPLATVRVRYKEPDGQTARELAFPFERTALQPTFVAATAGFRFAAAVTEFAEILRRSKHSQGARFDDVLAVGRAASDGSEEKAELLTLVDVSKHLWTAGR